MLGEGGEVVKQRGRGGAVLCAAEQGERRRLGLGGDGWRGTGKARAYL